MTVAKIQAAPLAVPSALSVTTTRQIGFKTPGGPDQLTLQEIALPEPAADEVQLRHTAIGVNYVDIYFRAGIYPMPKGETVPGVEAVGIVEKVGPKVRDLQPGDRVIYAGFPLGAYAETRNIEASRLLRAPDGLSDHSLAGSLLRGMTAHLLLDVVGRVQPGQTVLIHAAAGGLGLILTQWASRRGARTIGTVSSTDKAALAVSAGLDQPILYRERDFVAETLALTDGKGADLVIDGVGGDHLLRSIAASREFGSILNIGQTAGPVPPIDISRLTNRALSRPSVLAYLADPTAYRCAAKAWFSRLECGLTIADGHDYALQNAAQAHADMEAGQTNGPVRLLL